jgi:predicted Rossmann fold flavoprotein
MDGMMPTKSQKPLQHYDVIIIGAGAAGLMCAIEAGKRKRSVLLLEHNDRVGKKIRISGGGRCNFTNIHTSNENYISTNPHFFKSALSRYTPKDFIALVKKHHIPFHEKKLGQLFCDGSAQQIIDLLKNECEQNNVTILLKTQIHKISKDSTFVITTNQGNFECESLVVATGGLSIPKLGTSDLGYKIARQFDIHVNECRPGLVPLLFSKTDQQTFQDLSGISLDSEISFNNQSFRENILFTHRGLSGPAVLQISSYWQAGQSIKINLLPDTNILNALQEHHQNKTTLKNFLSQYFPKRFAEIFSQRYLNNKPLNQYTPKQLKHIADQIHCWHLTPVDDEGYKKAEVTVGGIDTNELSSKTMASKKIPNLYFIGEVVDVTGHLGGFNFQWAWASGFCAGLVV